LFLCLEDYSARINPCARQLYYQTEPGILVELSVCPMDITIDIFVLICGQMDMSAEKWTCVDMHGLVWTLDIGGHMDNFVDEWTLSWTFLWTLDIFVDLSVDKDICVDKMDTCMDKWTLSWTSVWTNGHNHGQNMNIVVDEWTVPSVDKQASRKQTTE
jgi:hypothetical protein